MKQKPPPRYFEPLARLATLIDAMPPVMPPHDVKPLRLRIGGEWSKWCRHHGIAAETNHRTGVGRWFLSKYINSFDYKQAILSNKYRYDLEGNIAGVVTEAEKAHAQEWLDNALAQIKSREDAA